MIDRIAREVGALLRPSPYRRLIEQVRPNTLTSPGKLKSLIERARQVTSAAVPGDFVECGVYKGGSAAALSRYMPEGSRMWLYDSFEGMPPASEKDGAEAAGWAGKCAATTDDVRQVMARVGTRDEAYLVRKGWFDQTFREPLPGRVALLHCDADWYDSVALVLRTFYPLIPPGGCVVLDDFGCWEGCRQAFYDFCCATGEKPLLERVEYDQAYWIKGKEHNRP